MQSPTQPIQNTSEKKKEVQAQIVALITKKLETGEMTPDRAKEIASMILEKMPEDMSDEQLLEIIPKLDDHFNELAQVVVPIMLDYEAQMRMEVNRQIDEHLKQKDFDSVLQITKQAIEKEKQLT